MKVLPDQGHTMAALPRLLSLLQLSLLSPAQDLPEDGCPLPFRAQSQLWVTCARHRWRNANKQANKLKKKWFGLGFFGALGRKEALPPLS